MVNNFYRRHIIVDVLENAHPHVPLLGYLKWTLDCIVECNFLCDCNYNTCPLRVVQKGLTKRLEVFWTGRERGWGVRSLDVIKAGAFICEYAGELLPESVAETRGKELSDNYLFDLARHGAGK
ncbi:histone-lysine n-methyltransferase, bat/ehmt, putative, partial [Perkinsus marinus ATCC 50983]